MLLNAVVVPDMFQRSMDVVPSTSLSNEVSVDGTQQPHHHDEADIVVYDLYGMDALV